MFGVSAARAQAASDVASDVHLYGLSEEEEPLIPAAATSADIDKYLLARNLILSAWRGNVNKYLSLNNAISLLPPSLAVHGEIAWTFLTTLGFINFSVACQDGPSKLHGRTFAKPAPTGSVIVIGAGLAGLTAARQLVAFGYKVVVVEAQERAGGRVHTLRLEGGGQEAVGDLGGAVITGIDGNPLAVLARQLRIPMHHIASDSNEDCPLYVEQGGLVDALADAKASEAWAAAENATLNITEQYTAETAEVISLGTFFKVELADKMAAGHPLRNVLRWMYANTEFSAAALATDLSATRWADDDKFEFSGAHVWLPGGNARLVKALAADVPILYNTPVSEVHHGSDGVTVVTESGLALSADAVVVTVPLGVLKAKKILFKPPLPPSKLRAIDRFGFGVLNKVVLLFPTRWWDPSRDTFGHIVPDDQQPGLLYLWYCVAEVAGGHLLAALVAGQAALDIEQMSDEAVLQLVMRRLRSFHPDRDVPYPVSAVVTRWGSDPYTLGSYSSVPPGCNGSADYREIAANVDGRLFFAGEATTYKYPAQMHGAFESGLREAAKVHAAFQCRHSQRNRDALVEGDIGSENAATMEQQARLALLLAAEFHAGADVEIGCCSAIHAAFSAGHASQWAILRVDISHTKGSRGKIPCEYHLVPLRAVMEVVDMKGTADECSDFLMSQCEPAVQFHNRKAPSAEQVKIMEDILECRNGKLPDLDDLLGKGALPLSATSLLHELAKQSLQSGGNQLQAH